MKHNIYSLDENLLPSRLDKILTALSGESRSKIQKLIKEGKVHVDGRISTDSGLIINSALNVSVEISESQPSKDVQPKDIDLDIVYEDDDLAVINKQSGLTVHPGAGNYDDTLVNALVHRYANNLSSSGGNDRAGIVHRLDRDTTGLMVVAKNDETHRYLASQIAEKSAQRKYLAIVWGALKNAEGRIITQISRSNRDRTKMAVVDYGGKEAITDYKTLKIFPNKLFSYVECSLHTGRTHQIRVHLSYIGHSIVGDQVYGTNDRKIKQITNPMLKDALQNFKRQALCAYYLSFVHPRTKEKMEFTIEPPEDFARLLGIMSS